MSATDRLKPRIGQLSTSHSKRQSVQSRYHAGARQRARLRRQIVGAATALALALTVAPMMHRPHLRLVWNVSPSVPLGLYRIMPAAEVRTGELVAVRPPPALSAFMDQRHYVEAGALLIKPVAATAGTRICRHASIVTIDQTQVANAFAADRFRRPLPSWSGCRTLRSGELFLIAQAKRDSFDSRYFGALPASTVLGRAVPLWTWG